MSRCLIKKTTEPSINKAELRIKKSNIWTTKDSKISSIASNLDSCKRKLVTPLRTVLIHLIN